MSRYNEATIEDAALDYFRELGYSTAWGPNLAPGESGQERESFQDVILKGRLRGSIGRINAGLDLELIDEAVKKLQRAESQNPIDENYRVYKLITEGVGFRRIAAQCQDRLDAGLLEALDNLLSAFNRCTNAG